MRVSCKISRVCKISKVLYLQNGPGRSSGLSLGFDHQNAPPLCSGEPTTHGPSKTRNLAAMLQSLLNCLSLGLVAAAARSSERRCSAGRHARHFYGPVPPLKGVALGLRPERGPRNSDCDWLAATPCSGFRRRWNHLLGSCRALTRNRPLATTVRPSVLLTSESTGWMREARLNRLIKPSSSQNQLWVEPVERLMCDLSSSCPPQGSGQFVAPP